VHAVRDVRRLVVALSRARLGLYVFGKKALFDSCIELGPSFAVLNSKPSRLQLVLNEKFPTSRKAEVCVCELSAPRVACDLSAPRV
jgi:intron-binding protein aquarius